ncbi:MAG: putative Ig domain-containing protein [Prosthecobacter sp.]|nr:putative Ig domain-containing protein [Prosthecobacter sp.]
MASFCLLVVLPSLVAEVPQFAEPVLTETELQVGTWVEANPELLSDPEGLTFRAKRLPPGLICDRETGTLSGYPTRPGTYKVEITATHEDKSKAVGKVTLTVGEFPAEWATEYQGLVEYSLSDFVALGGVMTFKVTSKGSFSGQLVLVGKKYAFRGSLKSTDGLTHEALISLTDDLSLRLQTQEEGQILGLLQGRLPEMVKAETEEVLETSIVATPRANSRSQPATWTKGTFNIALEPLQAVDYLERPAGSGYLTAKVKADGRVDVSGRLADGTVVTSSSFLLVNQTLLQDFIVYVPLYRGQIPGTKTMAFSGVLQGAMTMETPEEDPEYQDPTQTFILGHSINPLLWIKSASEIGSYPEGFSIPLRPTGFFYSRPARGELMLGATPGYLNAKLSFPAPALLDFDFQFTLSKGGRVNVSAPGDHDGISKFKLSINEGTGIFTGSFVVMDPNDGAKKAVFSGAILTSMDGIVPQGYGHVLLSDSLKADSAFISEAITLEPKEPEYVPGKSRPGSGPGLPNPGSSGGSGAGLAGPSGGDRASPMPPDQPGSAPAGGSSTTWSPLPDYQPPTSAYTPPNLGSSTYQGGGYSSGATIISAPNTLPQGSSPLSGINYDPGAINNGMGSAFTGWQPVVP